MRLIGGGLIAAAGLWCGLLAARRLERELERCAMYIRMLELLAWELERFKTPLPELFSTLAAALEGEPARLCQSLAHGLLSGEDAGSLWREALLAAAAQEREILLPLGSVLGRYGAPEQAASVLAVKERMEDLCRERRNGLRERRRVLIGIGTAGGIFLSVLLL